MNLAGSWRVSEEALREFVKTQTRNPPKGGWRAHSSGGMFSHFTGGARRVVELAALQSRGLDHDYVGAEHLLLAMTDPGCGISAQALKEHGIDTMNVREAIAAIVGTGTGSRSKPLPFTTRAKRVMSLSLREALHLGHAYIGSEHLLLGLIREAQSVGFQILMDKGVSPDSLRQTVIRLIAAETPV